MAPHTLTPQNLKLNTLSFRNVKIMTNPKGLRRGTLILKIQPLLTYLTLENEVLIRGPHISCCLQKTSVPVELGEHRLLRNRRRRPVPSSQATMCLVRQPLLAVEWKGL